MPKTPGEGQLGPVTAMEIARRHGMTREQAQDVAAAAAVDIDEFDFGYLTRSAAERFIAEVYRRRGFKILERRRRKERKACD